MPSMAAEAPENYVRPVPLPIPSHKGIKIQARGEAVYVPSLPERSDVRVENFHRRATQWTQQGFRAVDYRPYQGIGDPFYLDAKQVILHALGQWNVSESAGKANDRNSQEVLLNRYDTLPTKDNQRSYAERQKKDQVPLSANVDRLKKHEKDLRKEIVHGRETIRRVFLGHDFFRIVKEEIQTKESKVEREKQLQRELLRNQPRAAKFESGSSSEEGEVENENDENKHGDHIFTSVTDAYDVKETKSTRHSAPESSLPSTRKIKIPRGGSAKCLPPEARPYMPQHSNLAAECKVFVDRSALFRQMCILDWILEMMNQEDQVKITRPIATCWTSQEFLQNPDSVKKDEKSKKEKLHVENRWRAFSVVPSVKNAQRPHLKATVRPRYRRVIVAYNHGISRADTASVMSSSDAMSIAGSSSSQLDDELFTKLDLTARTNDTESIHSVHNESVVSTARTQSASPARLVRDITSLTSDTISHSEASVASQRAKPTPVSRATISTSTISNIERRELERLSRHTRLINELAEDEKDRFHHHGREEKGSRNLKSAAPTEHIQKHAETPHPSIKWKTMPQRMRSQFTHVYKEKDLVLQDTIESLERGRLRNLEKKFVQIPANMTINSALKIIRKKQRAEHYKHMGHKKPELYQKWFIDLVNTLTDDAKDKWYFHKILDKLGSYGLVESGKQSKFKFNQVLACLRDWEICTPDVSAAIEFCRDSVVEQSVEEFEKWFREAFPHIVRPSTTAASVSADTGNMWSKNVSKVRGVTSAPARLRRVNF